MRIITTSDTHFPFELELFDIEAQEDDVFIHAGDFMYAGYESEWRKRLDSFEKIPCNHKYLVAGNHDLHMERYPGPALQELRAVGVDVVGEPGTKKPYRILPNGMKMLGLPYVSGLPNWAFNKSEEWLYDYIENLVPADIIVSHSPPHGILDNPVKNYGIKAYRHYLQHYPPQHWICGHIHEDYGTHAEYGTIFWNVSMCNRDYRQVNPPMIIEV
jgi:hypothetical protein